MNIINLYRPSIWPRVAFGAAVAATLCLAAGMAMAGECPADKRVAYGQARPLNPTEDTSMSVVLEAAAWAPATPNPSRRDANVIAA